jgi:hypothetical protein
MYSIGDFLPLLLIAGAIILVLAGIALGLLFNLRQRG